ncbi:MAG: peptidase [Verrucomicrobia bacterium]|nr:peptidase [Verrucomicrobiota bacterium]
MKSKSFLLTTCAFLIAGLALSVSSASAASEAALKAKAKISQETAIKTALESVPNGKIQSAEIEKENGKLVWSFDISVPDSKNITEVQVDAMTGKVVSTEVETPQDQAKEAAADNKKKN